MAVTLTLEDFPKLPPNIDPETVQDRIDDALALAFFAAPCLESPTLPERKANAAKAIIRGAILRSFDQGTGALSSVQRSAGPFQRTDSYDTRSPRTSIFWKSEINQLREICNGSNSGAFHIDTAPGTGHGIGRHQHHHHHHDGAWHSQGHGIIVDDPEWTPADPYWAPGDDDCLECLL